MQMANATGEGAPAARDTEEDTGFEVLVGWSHSPFSRGIQMKVQAKRAEGGAAGAVRTHRLLLTRNQALLLAKSLLDATGQSLPAPVSEGTLGRMMRKLTGG